MFQTLTLKERGTMGFGGNHKGNITGMYIIGNSYISINNIWLIDGLKHNLLRMSQFCDSGNEVMFNNNNCIVINESDKSMVFKVRERVMFIKLISLNWLIIRYFYFYQ